MYEAYSDYESMMNMAEEIITRCALAVNGKLTLDYQVIYSCCISSPFPPVCILKYKQLTLHCLLQGVEICLERPWRRETMHNLVKEATGIDFNKFGDDLSTAKEVTLRTLEIGRENLNKSAIEACSSVGHVLNEVDEYYFVHILNFTALQ